MKGSKTKYLYLLAILMLTVSCWKKVSEDDMKAEQKLKIQNFLSSNDTLTFIPTSSGMYHTTILEGTGLIPVANDSVGVYYTLKFLNGTVLESNTFASKPYVFPVGQDHVFKGFDEGVTYMKEGGESLFVIPSELAFGDDGTYGIERYTPVLLDIKLVKVYQIQ